MAIATYRPHYARQETKALARPVKPTAAAARKMQEMTESRAYDLIFERGKILANLEGADTETVRRCGAQLFFRWQDRQTIPSGLPDILQILAARIEQRQQEIKQYRSNLDARLDWEENHLA